MICDGVAALAESSRRGYSPAVDLDIPKASHPAAESDAILVTAAAAGNREALARLYDRHAAVLLAIGARIVGDRAQAEDVLHDVFVEAWHHASEYDAERGSVRSWLGTRMRSRALDLHRRKLRGLHLEREALPGEGDTGKAFEPAATVDGERVRGEVADLSQELRAVIDLAYYEGLTRAEIADRLQIPIGTVKSRMVRAVDVLKARIGPSSGGRP